MRIAEKFLKLNDCVFEVVKEKPLTLRVTKAHQFFEMVVFGEDDLHRITLYDFLQMENFTW